MTEGLVIVIPARRGSKGLKDKNLQIVGGWSLLEWASRAVDAAGLGSARVILSTEDEEIAAHGRDLGLEVPFLRPTALASDSATARDVVLDLLDRIEADGPSPAVVLLLLPTQPFRRPEHLRQILSYLEDADTDAAVTVSCLPRASGHLYELEDDGRLSAVGPTENKTRRQDLKPVYLPDGGAYAIRVAALRRHGAFLVPRTRGVPTDPVASIDIDNPMDLAVARAVADAGLTWRNESTPDMDMSRVARNA